MKHHLAAVFLTVFALSPSFFAQETAPAPVPAQIQAEQTAPFGIALIKPSYRDSFYPGQDSSEIRGIVVPDSSFAAGSEIEAVLAIEGGEKQTMKLKSENGAGVPFVFDSRALPENGQAVLTVKLLSDGKEVSSVSRTIRRLRPPEGINAYWIEDGVLIRNGQPVYLRYTCAVGYRGGKAFDARYKADDFADTPFRRRSVEPRSLIRGIEDKEARKDVVPCPELFEKVRKVVEKSRNDPDCDFYYLCDEPDYRCVSPVFLKHVYEFIRELDPYHPVLIITREMDRYQDAADVFTTHPYITPLKAMGRRILTIPIHQIRNHLTALTKFHRPDKVVGFTGQFFSYICCGHPLADYPTWGELESMSWSAIANGSRLQLPYAYHDLGDRPWIYAAYKYFNHSIKALEKLLLSNNKLPVKATDPEDRIDVMLTEADGVTLLIVVNLKNGPLQTVVSSEHLKKFDSLLEFRGTGSRKIGNGELELSLKPYECVVLTSKKMDEGLETRDQVMQWIAREEKARTGRGNLLFDKGLSLDVKAHNLTRGTMDSTVYVRSKLFDGVRDVQAWSSRPKGKQPQWLEVHFWKDPPKFSRLGIYGSPVDKIVVKVWDGKEWKDIAAKSVENGEYSSLRDLGEEIATPKLRLEFPEGVPVELFYAVLDRDPDLRARALSLRQSFSDQEDVLAAFLALAEEAGLPFTLEEYLTVQYERASFVNSNDKIRKETIS